MRLRAALIACFAITPQFAGSAPADAADSKTLTVTTTEALVTADPYLHTNSLMYSVGCQIYGCLGRYNYETRAFEGMLASKWERVDEVTWRFHLRPDLVRHDGGKGPTSADVVNSYKQIMTNPKSPQRFFLTTVKDMKAVDERTVDVVTKAPNAALLASLFDFFAITSTEAGPAKTPYGWGPYKLKKFAIGEELKLERHGAYPGISADAPGEVIIRKIQEPDQRVTALLNGEVQIAGLIPPQLEARLKSASGVDIRKSLTNEPMFIGFNVKMDPWKDVRLRKAAAMAINKQLIIDKMLLGAAAALDGPVGKEMVCFTGALDKPTKFDPQAARKLLAEAGYPNGGPAINFYTSVGRYVSDRQVSEAITQMLSAVGFKVTLHTPEFANMFVDVRDGKSPMYYLGRGLALEPLDWMPQYLMTGVSPRTGYSNPNVDALFAKANATFNQAERCRIVRQIAQAIEDDVPMIFLWNHQYVFGARKNVEFSANATGEIWFPSVRIR